MKGHRSQRGSRSRQTGGTVLRLHRPGAYWWQSNLHRAPTAADARIGRRVRWWPLSLCLGGPGEPSGGSVRPRGRPLRPDGVRTAPMRAWTDPRRGKGVKPTTLRPSHQAYRRPRSENPRPLRHCGLRLTLAARRRRSRRARLTLGMGWFGWASRPLLRPLLGVRQTSWQAKLGGTAYRDHRKAAGRAADERRQRVGREADPTRVSFSGTALFFGCFYVTDVTVARNGCSCGSHALYVLQGCQAA